MDNPLSLTSASLLGRVCCAQTDQAAWAEFIQRYGPHIYGWCQQCKLQEADAEDVTQTVLAKLFRRLRRFEYDPDLSFRGWLRKVTQDSLSDFFRSRQRKEVAEGGSRVTPLIESAVAREQLKQQLESLFDLELLEEAMARVQKRVTPARWEAYRMTSIEGLSGVQVAADLGMKVAVVYSAKSKIQRMIKQEITILEEAPASVVAVPAGRSASS